MINFNSNKLEEINFNNQDVQLVKDDNGNYLWAKPMGTVRTKVEGSDVNLTSLVRRTASYEPTASIGIIQTGPEYSGGTPVYYGDTLYISSGYDANYDYYIYGSGEIIVNSKHQDIYLGADILQSLYIKTFVANVGNETSNPKRFFYVQYYSTSTVSFDIEIKDHNGINHQGSLNSLMSYPNGTYSDYTSLPTSEYGIIYYVYKNGNLLGNNSAAKTITLTQEEYASASFNPTQIFSSIVPQVYKY